MINLGLLSMSVQIYVYTHYTTSVESKLAINVDFDLYSKMVLYLIAGHINFIRYPQPDPGGWSFL